MKRLLRWLAALAVVALCVLLARRMDLGRAAHAIAHADWRLLALAVLLNLTINSAARVQRWRALLAPLERRGAGAGFFELAELLFASYALNNLLPARAGEPLRTIALRRHGYSVGALVAAQLVEKIIEALSMGLLAVPVAILVSPSPALTIPLLSFAAIGLAGVVFVFLSVRRAPRRAAWLPEGLRDFFERLHQAIHLLRAPSIWLSAIGWSCLSDLADVTMVGLCLSAVGLSLGVGAWMIVFLAINLIIAVPSTPGQLGVLEAGAVLVLSALHVGGSEALAFGVLYHAAHVVPTTLVGLVGLVAQWRRRRAAPPA